MATRSRFNLAATLVLPVLFLGTGAHAMSYALMPLDEITDQTDYWIRGEVLSVESRRLDHDERYTFGYEGSLEVKVVVRVREAVPALQADEITIDWTSNQDFLRRILNGRECIAAISQRENGTYKSLWALGLYGWFQPEADTGLIDYVWPIGKNVSPDFVWQLVRDLQLTAASSGQSDADIVQEWTDRLNDGDTHKFFAAVVFFNALPEPRISPADFMSALENAHDVYRERTEASSTPRELAEEFRRSLPTALAFLQRVGDQETTKRLIDLYLHDLQIEFCGFEDPQVIDSLIDLIITRGGEERCAILKKLMVEGHSIKWQSADGKYTASRTALSADDGSKIFKYKGDDIDELLLDMLQHPSVYGITRGASLAIVWGAIAQRGLPQIKTYLGDFRANPDAFDLGVERSGSQEELLRLARNALVAHARALPQREQVEELLRLYHVYHEPWILEFLVQEVTREDTDLVPALTAIPASELQQERSNLDTNFAQMAAEELPDPVFLPQLRELVKTNPDARILRALHACGDEKLARSIALERLKQPVPTEEDGDVVHRDAFAKRNIIEFLGTLNDPKLVSAVKPYADPKVIDKYRIAALKSDKIPDLNRPDYGVADLHQTAILALTHLGGEHVARELRKVYRRGDIFARVTAAMSLYALGDDTGKELIDIFVEHRESEHTDIMREWRMGLRTDFYHAAKSLKDSRTDGVLLGRIKRGFSNSDIHILGYHEFAEANLSTLLPIFVENLSNDNAQLREYAYRLLGEYIDENNDYNPGRSPRRQQAAINHLRDQVNAYLANKVH